MDKNSLRKEFLVKRLALSRQDVKETSTFVQDNFFKNSKADKKNSFLVYIPVNNEVETEKIIKKILALNKKVFIPAFDGLKWVITRFITWNNLIAGPYGILQPDILHPAKNDEIEVAILPGVAFSDSGVRLGYGKGVFDMLLAKSTCEKIGLCYDFQIAEDIPHEQQDLKMDLIISEKRVLVPGLQQ